MTLTILCGFEPGADDVRMWVHNTAAVSATGWSAPTTTTSALSPSDARRWMKATDAGSVNILICRNLAITPDTYIWYVQRDLVIEGTIPVGYAADYVFFSTNDPGFADRLAWRIIRGSATNKYKIELQADIGGGALVGTTSELTTDTRYHVRVEMDGTNWTLWVDGVQEVQAARTTRIDAQNITLARPTASSGVEHYWAGGALCMSTSESDRPGSSDVEVHDFEVDTGGSESEAGWGDDGNCDSGSTTAAITDVALDGSDQVDTTTYWCEFAADTDAETVDTVTKTFTSGHTIGGGQWRGVRAANVGSKTVTAAARIYDGTAGTNVTIGNIGSTTWRSWHEYFPNAPAGGAWSQGEADGLKIGMQNEGGGGNGANTECAATVFTLVGLGNDPPPPAGADRRRLLGQVA